MSVNLEEKIKKENEQLQKSESLLEKTVKKAMNFGRKPKNTQKKTAPKTSRQEMPEEKEAAIPKETVKKESSKEESKKKSQPAKRSSNAKNSCFSFFVSFRDLNCTRTRTCVYLYIIYFNIY